MRINIEEHYFNYYAGMSEVEELMGYCVGDIIADWNGDVGCILTIYENGDVRTDSNGMGQITGIHKCEDSIKIQEYLSDLRRADECFMWRN